MDETMTRMMVPLLVLLTFLLVAPANTAQQAPPVVMFGDDVPPGLLVAVEVPNEPPDPSMQLELNGSWELGTQHWYGWENSCQYVDTANPFDGEHDLRQKCGDGTVWLYQVIDTSRCAPGSPVWVGTARWIVSNKLDRVDVVELSAFSVPNWTSLAFISQHSNLDASDSWTENWYRVDGLVDVAKGSFNLVIASSFTWQGVAYHTSFFRDKTRVRCIPAGVQEPDHTSFIPAVMNGR